MTFQSVPGDIWNWFESPVGIVEELWIAIYPPKSPKEQHTDEFCHITEALVVIFAIVFCFLYSTRRPVDDEHTEQQAMLIRLKKLDKIAWSFIAWVLYSLSRIVFILPVFWSNIDGTKASDWSFLIMFRLFMVQWNYENKMTTCFMLLRVVCMMAIFDNRLHLTMKTFFTKRHQDRLGTLYPQSMIKDDIARNVAFWTDSVKLFVVVFAAWPIVWCVKDTFVGLVFCGLFMVFYYEIWTTMNFINMVFGYRMHTIEVPSLSNLPHLAVQYSVDTVRRRNRHDSSRIF
jgi:hypothetical protein